MLLVVGLAVGVGVVYFLVTQGDQVTVSSTTRSVSTLPGGSVHTVTNTLVSTVSATSELASLQGQITQLQDQIASLQGQVNSDASQINSLQGQVTTLQNELSLQVMTTEYQNTIEGTDGQPTYLVSFTAQYAGYLEVTGTSNNQNLFFTASDSFSGYPLASYQYAFGYGTTLYVPILPGQVTVYVSAPCGILGCFLQGGSFSATLTVSYYD